MPGTPEVSTKDGKFLVMATISGTMRVLEGLCRELDTAANIKDLVTNVLRNQKATSIRTPASEMWRGLGSELVDGWPSLPEVPHQYGVPTGPPH